MLLRGMRVLGDQAVALALRDAVHTAVGLDAGHVPADATTGSTK